MKSTPERRFPIFRLGLLTFAALVIHGYHLGVEDAEIYLPAARKFLKPELYPFAAEFFQSHEHLSLFSPILAWTARLSHLSIEWTVCLWYIATIYLMLAASWMLAVTCFRSQQARWCSVLLIAAVLTMPATNTGLLLMDPYITARSFSTPLTLIALSCLLHRRFALAAAATLLIFTIHLQMGAYLVPLGCLYWLTEKPALATARRVPALAGGLGFLPLSIRFMPAAEPYREALYARNFFFLSSWTWYHWLGMLAPLALFAWFSKGKLRFTTPASARLSLILIPFGVLSILAGAVIASSHDFDFYARLQPLRCFHLITIVFVLMLGGLLGEYVAKWRPWAAAALIVAVSAGMFAADTYAYPNSNRFEFPWEKTSTNDWVNALLWIRQNTPEDAVFAVDSRYFKSPGVDVHGFRAVSGRAALADYYKDGGVVAIFPQLASDWKQMSNATYDLNHFSAGDFVRLRHEFPVSWAIIHGTAPDGMSCPYQQRGYSVCTIPAHLGPSHSSRLAPTA